MTAPALPAQVAILDRAEVCVIGGGLAGVTAALHTAAAGLDTVLLEERGALGWEVSHGLDIFLIGPELPLTLQRWVEQLAGQNAARGRTLDVCALECLLDRVLLDAGVRFHFRAFCGSVDLAAGIARATTKSGPLAVTAHTFVDATEGARVARRLGARFAPARAADGPTHRRAFLLCAVEPPAATTPVQVDGIGRIEVSPTLWPDEAHVALSYRPPNPERAEAASRFLIARTIENLRRTQPGFERAGISISAHESFPLWTDTIDTTTLPDRLFVAGPSVLGRGPSLEERVALGERIAAAVIARGDRAAARV